MILKREIERIAEQKTVAKSTIDKDWVLGHFIDAIFSIPVCRENLVFKGGTCLKKCYFGNYRFSEDLDFTCVPSDFVLDKNLLKRIISLVTERTEIPLHIHKLELLRFNGELTGYSAIIKFWGADHPRNQAPPPIQRWLTSIKIEIILYEQMIFPAEIRTVYHEYSDQLSENAIKGVPCYSIHEVLAEKLRALIQRSYTAPRDYYDIWYLSENVPDLNWHAIKEAFFQKMKFKKIVFTGIDQLINEQNDKHIYAAWNNSLAHQIPDGNFPEFGIVRDRINRLLIEYFL